MRKILSSDSICAKFLTPSLVICGKGNELQLIKNRENILINKIRPYDKIHKISFIKQSSSFKVVCAAGREILVTNVNSEEKFEESFLTKISDWISSIKYLNDGTIAAVTAHNVAILLELIDRRLIIKKKLKCENNSTLYCSHIHGESWKDLIFFAGTALGELIIWKQFNDIPSTLYQKSLHNGVIFSIDFHHNFLLTSSDDRSIKIYAADDNNWQLSELTQCFGHTSRIFACKIIKYLDSFLFLSAGEDGNFCIWHQNGNLITKKNVNPSGGLWSVDYDEESSVVITSSSTGKLNRFQLHETMHEVVHSDLTKIGCEEIGQPVKLKYLADGTLCVLDIHMQIFTHNHITGKWTKVLQLNAEKQKVVAIEAWQYRLFFMTGNSILIFDYDTTNDKLYFSSELVIDRENFPLQFNYFRAMHALSFHRVFISDASGLCIVVDLLHKKLMNTFKIPKSKEPWSTSVAHINQFWLIADRMGSLFLYRLDNQADEANCVPNEPIQKLKKLHCQNVGVKTIRVLENGFIKTTGSDGTVKTLFLDQEKEILQIFQCEKTAVKWIERVENFNGKEYILGFNDNYFVIARSDGGEGEIIYEHSCGGRHRHWDLHCSLIKSDSKVRLVYIKRQQVNCVEFFLNNFTFLPQDDNFSWHTRVCNVVRMIDGVKILASGGEDTLIKLFHIEMMSDDGVSLRRMAEINSHISSVKAMTMWRDNDDIWIITAGGRAQIVVTRVISMLYAKEEVNFMLTNSLTLGNSKQSTFDPETRFTSLHFDHQSQLLFVGCSDGYLRVFELLRNDSSASLRLTVETFYGKCIFQLYALCKSFVLTMSSDGIVCFWHFDNAHLKLIDKLYHNRNGINSFDVYTKEDENCHYRIATAGDDCSIYVSDIEIVVASEGCAAVKFHKTLSNHSAHTSQVTGIKFLSRDELITVSIDQSLCKLRLKADEIEIADRKFTCVADVKGFSFYDNDEYIFVHGAGLEVMKRF